MVYIVVFLVYFVSFDLHNLFRLLFWWFMVYITSICDPIRIVLSFLYWQCQQFQIWKEAIYELI